ncbi:MAG: cyclohexanecarboxyl-CoA dehydrogenase [Gammaproteobacteria bacterium]|nr:MAG: cyclohexanecarboxyl-CoA dehydrogenase [Gammaproteobacteria bacterium]RLA59388.1 MAG: cyclohexanecarboxyl-CoA dehydrogenase [Gammaproteobacteria bacterium]
MDFSLSEDQHAIQAVARRFARERLLPEYQARERAACVDLSVRKQIGELGLIGVELPEHYGGLGLDALTTGLIIEALAEGDFNVAYVILLGALNGQIIADHMAPEIAGDWLPGICRGEVLAAIALTEPGAGSDAANLRLSAQKVNGAYILNGEKTSISMADQADIAIVFARTGKAEEKSRGISAFLVPMDVPGISSTRFNDLGEHAVGRGSIFFDSVKVPSEYMIGDEGMGFAQVMQGFDFSRALIGLQCIASAQQSMKETWQFVNERQAFGQAIAAFQGVSFPLAEMETYLTAARDLCYKTLWLKDNGRAHTSEAAMCKWWAPKVAYEAIYQCLLTHGHSGYSRDFPFEQRLRDVLGLQIGDGTAQIMKMIISRQKVSQYR